MGIRTEHCFATDEMLTLNSYSYHIFMDNYFTSFRLLTHLGVYLSIFNPNALNYIRVTGGLNKNMLSKCTITGGKQSQKKEHYHFEQRISSKKGSTSLAVAGWKNNREVYIDFSESSESKRFVRRWNKVEKKYIQENNQVYSTVTTKPWILSTEWTRTWPSTGLAS